MAEALYRKYRPQVFEDVVGQEHIERTIKNAIERDKVSHAYLFTGPRGTGKTTTARLLAKALLCERGPTPEPDGTCEDCELIASGEHPDVYELDAASRTGVENVREEIIGRVQFAPTRGRFKIYIIDEVHMLSTAAFNALLKTLEEPPSHVVFILATTDPQKVPETIHSRCQRFDFRRISNDSIVSRLGAICVSEGVDFEGEALELIAHRAEGGMRNALTSLEQLIAFGEGRVTMEVAERMLGSLDSSDLAEIVRFVGARDVAACFKWTAEYVETGADLAQFTRDFAEHIRNLYVMSLAGAEVALDVTDAARREMVQELPMFGPDRQARLLGVLGDLSAELKTSTNPRLSFEIALTRMVRPESDLTLEGLAARIEELEARLAQGAVVQERPAAQAVPDSREGAADAFGSGGARFAGAFGQNHQVKNEAAFAEAPRANVQNLPASSNAERGGTQGAFAAAPASMGVSPGADAGRAEGFAPAPSAANAASMQPDPGAPRDSVAAASVSGVPDQLAAQLRNPAALQRLWQTVLASLKKAKTAYGVLFLNTKAVFDEAASCLVIEFPEENEFAFKAVQKPDVQDELAKCIAAACGAPLPYTMRKGSSGAPASAMGISQERSAAQSGLGSRESAPSVSGFAGTSEGRSQAGVDSGERPSSSSGEGTQRAYAEAPANVGTFSGSAAGAAQASAPGSYSQAQDTPPYEYDGPPLDSYDDYVSYGDDGYGSSSAAGAPWDEPAPRQAASQPVHQPSPGRAADVPPWESFEPAPAQPAQPAQSQASAFAGDQPASTQAVSEPSAADLDAVLAFGFGEGVTFTEV